MVRPLSTDIPPMITCLSEDSYELEGPLEAESLISIEAPDIALNHTATITANAFHARARESLNIATARASQLTLATRSINLQGASIWAGPNITTLEGVQGSVQCNSLFFFLREDGNLSQGQQTLKDWAQLDESHITYIVLP